MKTSYLSRYLPLLLLPLAAVLPSCSDDDDLVQITTNPAQSELHYSDDGTWSEVASNRSFTLQYLTFNHEGEIGSYGLVWKGFTPARYVGLDYSGVESGNWLSHQFQIPSQGGMAGKGTPYIVAFWDTQENETTPAEARSCRIVYSKTPTSAALTFRPVEMYVQLTWHALDVIINGNAFSRAFTTGDWFTLTAHGVKADGTETTTECYLADYRGEQPNVCASWTRMDLAELGEIKELYFTMASSDTGSWGMNTPSFFALDRLSIKAVLPD